LRDVQGFRGEVHPSVNYPFLYSVASQETREYGMIFESDLVAAPSVAALVLEAAARTGFSPSDIEAMVDSELDTLQLLDYITAVITNRMN